MRIFTLLTFRTKKSEHFYFVQTYCKVNRVAQTERNDWHNSTETGGIVYSETVALLMRRMQHQVLKFNYNAIYSGSMIFLVLIQFHQHPQVLYLQIHIEYAFDRSLNQYVCWRHKDTFLLLFAFLDKQVECLLTVAFNLVFCTHHEAP